MELSTFRSAPLRHGLPLSKEVVRRAGETVDTKEAFGTGSDLEFLTFDLALNPSGFHSLVWSMVMLSEPWI